VHLFELAIELGERSADMAEAAPGLGLEGVTPTSELTPEQVEVFRARYAKAPAMAGPGGPPGGAPYQPNPAWGPPPAGGPGAAPVPSRSGRTLGLGQMVAIALAVVAVLGLFAYMVKNGGTDQERLDEIAHTPPEDSDVPTTGPDGKPLTEQQLADIKAYDAATKANEQRLCAALRTLSNVDIAMGKQLQSAGSIDELKQHVVDGSNQTVAAYDELIPLMPDQAEGLRQLRQFTIDFAASVQAASGTEDLQARMDALTQQAQNTAVGPAAVRLDRFATDTCGVSTGNN